MERYLTKNASSSGTGNTLSTKGSGIEQKRARVELNMDDIVADLGQLIEEFDPAIRDEAKRAFLSMGPFQPLGHSFPWKEQGSQKREFIKS